MPVSHAIHPPMACPLFSITSNSPESGYLEASDFPSNSTMLGLDFKSVLITDLKPVTRTGLRVLRFQIAQPHTQKVLTSNSLEFRYLEVSDSKGFL